MKEKDGRQVVNREGVDEGGISRERERTVVFPIVMGPLCS